MAAAQNVGNNNITKVLESICRERRREHLDKESEGEFNAFGLTWGCFKVKESWISLPI